MTRSGGRQDHDADWREHAACSKSGVDPQWFFPEVGDPGAGIAHAKRTCATCPVIAPCLEYGLSTSIPGVMGGMTVLERKKERRRRITLGKPA